MPHLDRNSGDPAGGRTYVCARTDIGGLLTRQVAGLGDAPRLRGSSRARTRGGPARMRPPHRRRRPRLREALDLRNETVAPGTAAHSPTPISPSTSRSSPQPTNPVLDELFAGISEPLRATYDFTEGVHEPELGAGHHRNVGTGSSRATSRSRRAGTCGHLDLFVAGVHERRADAERSARSGVEISRIAFRSRKVFSAWHLSSR